MKRRCFFASSCKFRKAKFQFNNYWVGMLQNGQDHGTLKSGAFQK